MFLNPKRVLSCVILVYLLPACREGTMSQARPVDTVLAVNPPAPKEVVLLNQHYGDDALQTIDIYLPAGRSVKNTRLMVFVHGGGWAGGDKSDFTVACENLVKNPDFAPGYAFANINYRIVIDGRNRFPAAEEDVTAAMSYLYAHADSLLVSPSSALIGASAGGQLATLIAYKHNEKKHIRCVVSTWGPYDMKRFYEEGYVGVPDMLKWVTGYTPAENSEVYAASSSVRYVSAASPPTFLAHGSLDSLVRLNQGQALDSALSKYGVPHIFYIFRGYHGYPSDSVANDAAAKMFGFIAKYMK